MKLVLFWIFLLFCLFRLCPAQASDWSLRFGPSIQEGTTNGSSKVFGLRREAYQFYGIYSAVELGGYVDNGGDGRKSSGLLKAQLGMRPGPETGVYGFGFVGPCGLTATDSRLGSNYQFATDIGIGVRDPMTSISIGYGHISNAGLKLPNSGRDFLIFSIGISI